MLNQGSCKAPTVANADRTRQTAAVVDVMRQSMTYSYGHGGGGGEGIHSTYVRPAVYQVRTGILLASRWDLSEGCAGPERRKQHTARGPPVSGNSG